jgi:hypothetical protein
VLRGGGGLFYDQGPMAAIAASGDTAQSPLPVSGAIPRAVLFSSFSAEMQRAYVETASLGIEQRLTAHTSLTADYQFARGLQMSIPLYQPLLVCAQGASCSPGQAFRTTRFANGAQSSYQGFTVAFEHDPTRWGNYRVAYSHASADSSGALGNGSYASDNLRRLSFTSGLHTSDEAPAGVLQRFSRGLAFTTTGDYSRRSEFTGLDFVNLNARLTKTLAWGAHYRLDALAETMNSFERTSAPFLKSFEGMGERYVNVYSTYRAVASLQAPNAARFGLRLGF